MLLVVLLWLPLPDRVAHASDAGALLRECIGHYAMADFAGALAACRKAAKETRAPAELARIHLFLGLCYHGQRDQQRARKEVAAALSHDPGLTLDPRRHKKSVLLLLQQVKGQVLGRLVIHADRPNARVLLDGKPRGRTPFEGAVLVGRHKVLVRTDDGKYRKELYVQVTPGRLQLVLPLVLVSGTLSVSSTPAGAKVLVDGKRAGTTPLEGHPLPPGRHRVAVQREGYRPWRRQVTVEPDRKISLALELETAKLPATLPAHRPAEPPSFWRRERRWTWVAAGTAAAFALAGAGVGLSTLADHDEYANTDDPRRFDELEQTIPSRVTATNVLFGIAGAAALTSVVLLFLEGRTPTGESGQERAGGLRVTPVAGQLSGVVLGARF